MVLKETVEVFFKLVKERLVGEFSFSHLIPSLTLGSTKQRRIQWSVREFSWEKERKERERMQCKWPQKRESHVYD